jgi:hypothetical protein
LTLDDLFDLFHGADAGVPTGMRWTPPEDVDWAVAGWRYT